MLKLSDLALRPDIQIGPMLVSPSRRLVEGPGGHSHVEPLIMQVFLILLDAGGRVVTRTELFDQCWGGVTVGDDSLNRAIAKVRRTSAQVAPGLLEIETIPRTGYRLTGKILRLLVEGGDSDPDEVRPHVISRRTLVASGAVAAAAVGGGGYWWFRSNEDRDFEDLMARGQAALDASDPDLDPNPYFRRAAELRPDDATAQGKLAYALSTSPGKGEVDENRTSLQQAQRAAEAAFAIDRNEPSALLAQVNLQSGTLDFSETEDRLRQVLAIDPDNTDAMRLLWNMLQCVGRSEEALGLVQQALKLKPLAAGSHYPYAQLLWITGRTAEADRVIANAIKDWPTHRFIRFARFTIFAYTNRAAAALAMINNQETAPQNFGPETIALLKIALPALEQRTPASVAIARQAILEQTKANLRLTSQGAMLMSALGEVGTAFDVTNAYFAVAQEKASSTPAKSTAWRFAPWLFTPPTSAMRDDPRFDTLVDQIGLKGYWRAHRVQPDYLKV